MAYYYQTPITCIMYREACITHAAMHGITSLLLMKEKETLIFSVIVLIKSKTTLTLI